MFKKSMSMLLACAMCITMLASCGEKAPSEPTPASVPTQSASQPESKPAEKADITKLVIDKAGDYTAEKGVKDVEIKADGVTLSKSTGLNSVTIGKEVGTGSVTLDGVEAKSILIKGGGKNSVHFISSRFSEAILEQMNVFTRIVTDAKTTIGEMQANSPAILEIEGTVKSLIMGQNAKDSTIDVKAGANLTNLMLNAPTAVNTAANIATVSVYASAVGSSLTVADGATVSTLATEAKLELNGKGRIAAAITQIRANLAGMLKAGTVTINETPILTTGMPNTVGGKATGTTTAKTAPPATTPPPTTNTPPQATVDKTKLGDMLKVAAKDAAKVGTVWVQAESEFETKVYQHYVTKAQVDAYAAALKAAQAIFDDANATQKQVEDAQSSIAKTNATFTTAGLNQVGKMVWFSIDVLDNVTYETSKDGSVYRGVQTQLHLIDVDAKSVLKDTDKIEVAIAYGKNENEKKLASSTSKPGKKATTEIFNNTIGKVKDCATVFFAPNAIYPSDLWDTTNWTGATVADKPTNVYVQIYRTEYEVFKEIYKVETGSKGKYLLISQTYKPGLALNEKFTDATSKSPIAWADVIPKTATLSFADAAKSVTYGDAKFTNKATLSESAIAISYKSGDATIATVDAATGEVTVLKNGKVTITATSANTATHSSATKSYELTIAQKALTVKGATPKAKTYDGNTDVVLENGTLEGVVGKDVVTLATPTATAAANIGTVAVTKAAYTLAGTDSGKYTLTQPTISGTVAISPKALTVTGTTVADKVYDGTTNVILTNGTLEGVVGKDVVTLATLTGTTDKNVAVAATVTTNYTLEGTDKANYTLTKPSDVKVNIIPATLTIDAPAATDRTFTTLKDTEVALTGTLKGMVATEDATIIALKADAKGTASADVGVGLTVNTNYELTGTGAKNYKLTQPEGVTVTIGKKAAKAALAGITSEAGTAELTTKLMGLTGATEYDYILNGTVDLIAPDNELWKTAGLETGTKLMADSNMAAAKYIHIREHADLKYYMPATDFAIELVYKPIPSYGITMPAPKLTNGVTATLTGAITAQKGSTVDLTLTLTGTPDVTGTLVMDVTSVKAGVITTLDKQNIKITNNVAIAAGTTYAYTMTMPNEAVGDLVITLTYQAKTPQLPLNFTSQNTVIYGDAALTLVATGGESTIASTVTYAIDSNPNTIAKLNGNTLTFSGIGSVTITATKPGNLEFADATQTQIITVTPKALTVTGTTVADKVYDGTTNVVLTNGTLEGVVGKDVVTLATLTGTADKNVAVAATVTTNYTLDGTNKANYTLTKPSDVKVNIIPATLTIDAPAATDRTFTTLKDTEVALTGTLKGMVATEDATIIALKANAKGTASADVGVGLTVNTNYELTGTGAKNYKLTQPEGVTVTIGKKAAKAALTGITSEAGATAGTTKLVSTNLVDATTYEYIINNALTAVDVTNAAWQTLTKTGAELKKDFAVAEAATPHIHIREQANLKYQEAGVGFDLALTVKAKADQTPLVITPVAATYGEPVKTLATTGGSGAGAVVYTITKGATLATVAGDQLTIVGAGPITIKATKEGNADYNEAIATLDVTIAAKKVHLEKTAVATPNKVYDATTKVPLTGAAIKVGDILVGDSVELDVSKAQGDTENANHSDVALNVIVTGYALTGKDATKYEVVQPTGIQVATVIPKELTVTGLDPLQTKVYDGKNTYTVTGTATLNGKLGNDAVTLATNSLAATIASENVGDGQVVTLTTLFTLEGNAAGNYKLTNPTITANITAATLTVPTEAPTASTSIANGAKLSTISITGATAMLDTTVVPGSWAWKTPDAAVTVTGPQTAVFTPTTGAANYKELTTTIQVTVAP